MGPGGRGHYDACGTDDFADDDLPPPPPPEGEEGDDQGRDERDVDYIQQTGLATVIDTMMRQMLRLNPLPANPREWMLQYLRAHNDAHTPAPRRQTVCQQNTVPAKLWVSMDVGEQQCLGGLYRLVDDKEIHERPHWRCSHHDLRADTFLYSTSSGYWMFTDERGKMEFSKGLLSSASACSQSTMPHSVGHWDTFKNGSWVPTAARISSTLLLEQPVFGHEDDEAFSQRSPSFSPGKWESPRGVKPAGAGTGTVFMHGAVTVKPVHRLNSRYMMSGHAGLQGWRCAMEDAFSQRVLQSDERQSMFLVCDGHGSRDIAQHVATHLPDLLLVHKDEGAVVGDGRRNSGSRRRKRNKGRRGSTVSQTSSSSGSSVGPARHLIPHSHVVSTVRQLDEDILCLYEEGGCTATFCTISPPTDEQNKSDALFDVQVGNIGDSRAVVWSATDGKVVFETVDHKPSEAREKQRLRDAGYNYGDRIDCLAVSRAFGDKHEKQIGLTADPDVTDLRLATGDVLVIGCDGVFEMLSSADVMKVARSALKDSDGDPGAAAAAICDASLHKGVTDNISCIVVVLIDDQAGEQHSVCTQGLLLTHPAPSQATLPRTECVPGPYTSAWDSNFRKGYMDSVAEAGSTLAEALSQRYTDISIQLQEVCDAQRRTTHSHVSLPAPAFPQSCEDETSIHRIALRDEFALFHRDPEQVQLLRTLRGQERLNWFSEWALRDAINKT